MKKTYKLYEIRDGIPVLFYSRNVCDLSEDSLKQVSEFEAAIKGRPPGALIKATIDGKESKFEMGANVFEMCGYLLAENMAHAGDLDSAMKLAGWHIHPLGWNALKHGWDSFFMERVVNE